MMVKTVSSMLPLGTKAHPFSLPDVVTHETVTFNGTSSSKASVLMFICNHCPYVKHVKHQLIQLATDYQAKGVLFLAINANDAEQYPDDSPKHMQSTALADHYPFPYLFDETQEVAKAYQATCTPDFFVFDAKGCLAYRGQLDDSRPGNGLAVDGHAVRIALDCLLTHRAVPALQKPSLGCNIKWKLSVSAEP